MFLLIYTFVSKLKSIAGSVCDFAYLCLLEISLHLYGGCRCWTLRPKTNINTTADEYDAEKEGTACKT